MRAFTSTDQAENGITRASQTSGADGLRRDRLSFDGIEEKSESKCHELEPAGQLVATRAACRVSSPIEDRGVLHLRVSLHNIDEEVLLHALQGL